MKRLIICVFIFINVSSVAVYAKKEVCFSKQEAKAIVDQLEENRRIIKWQANRWKNLVDTKPNIYYKILDKKVVIQKVEFPIKNDKPLIYKVKFEVNTESRKYTFFPLRVNLGIVVESGLFNQDAENVLIKYVDPKLGLHFFGLEPLKIPFIRGLGLHVLVGIQSAGLSLSWGLMKKPLENLRIHFYGGITYKGNSSFGMGVTLNF